MADLAKEEHDLPRTVLIAYGSETGNSQDVAEELGRLTERLHFQARVTELDAIQPVNNSKLHDSRLARFNWASRKLYKRLSQLGANTLYPPGEGDEQHPESIEGTFIPWSLGLRKCLLEEFPLKAGQEPIPENERLPPKWVLSANQQEQPVESTQVASQISKLEAFDHDTRPIPNSITATLVKNERVTPSSHWQDVRHIILRSPESMPYSPGDILHITPKNFSRDVDALISLMGWEKDADIPLQFSTGDGSSPSAAITPPPIPFLQELPGFTLRTLLSNYLDIMAIPRRSFFSQVAHFTDDSMHKERLLEFTDPEYIDEFYDYATRARRSILEILEEFYTVKIPWQQACNVLPILRGRQFSLASGGKLKKSPDGGTGFELLIAIVKYQTVIKRVREGVCTRYIAKLQPGSTLKIQVQKGGLNSTGKQLSDPAVLIGPGTGVAPIRSLLWEKAALAEAFRKEHGIDKPLPLGPVILLYGGRNRSADYFFADEWEELKKQIDLRIFAAFSRDQKQKYYVQDVIREQSETIYDLLLRQEGSVFICGSSGNMPRAVREALIETFQKPLGVTDETREAAENYLAGMEKIGRYKQETW
ncbi:NAPDH-dependent diflavin reductase [Myotisia sp. PD_48]|nr:NAPDH-dependent diflavin reductase [Myotisia sp. PD_48]